MGEKLKEINSWDEVPEFGNEDEEDEFWSKHALGPALLEQMRPASELGGPPALKSMRELKKLGVTPETARRLQRIARIKGVQPEDLIHEFLTDRLREEEKRIGVK
ncbi:MAG: CopG family antitoxin [Rubrobacteraceae bacterium]